MEKEATPLQRYWYKRLTGSDLPEGTSMRSAHLLLAKCKWRAS